MKYIKLFENFNKSDLEKELDKYLLYNYTINSDGTIDVDGSVYLSGLSLKKLPFKFGKVTGKFDCAHNKITSLEGSPYYVGGHFYCNHNRLTNLKGSPDEVSGDFDCRWNILTSVEGMPSEIGGSFDCSDNEDLKEFDSISNIEKTLFCDTHVNLDKFKGYYNDIIPKRTKSINEKVKPDLETELDKYIRNNSRINSYTINNDGTVDVDGDVMIYASNLTKIPLKFGKVTGDFYVCQNKLKSLEGSPYYVGGDFDCYSNKLTSLKGSPKEVGGSFYASNNKLTSLEGMPLEIGGDFTCKASNIKDLDSISNIEGDIYCDKSVDTSTFRGYCKNIIKE